MCTTADIATNVTSSFSPFSFSFSFWGRGGGYYFNRRVTLKNARNFSKRIRWRRYLLVSVPARAFEERKGDKYRVKWRPLFNPSPYPLPTISLSSLPPGPMPCTMICRCVILITTSLLLLASPPPRATPLAVYICKLKCVAVNVIWDLFHVVSK